MFEKMLEVENISPRRIAYDRPSSKLISFLKKHYCLEKYIPQNNNFIVFDDYFQVNPILFRNLSQKVNLKSLTIMINL
jgi:alpha-tubulin N-acetyltransferase 1